MKKNRVISITMLTILSSSLLLAGGKGKRIDRSNGLDTNHYNNYSNTCREILLSGVIEIKNKNLDYDKNKIFFKHQRITYVIPDENNRNIKNCIRERATGINELDMKKLLKKLD